jgi:hypothetical protein
MGYNSVLITVRHPPSHYATTALLLVILFILNPEARYKDTAYRSKVVLLTGRGGHRGSETPRIPHFLRQSAQTWWNCLPYAPAALCPSGRFLVLISVRSCVNPRAIARLGGLGKLKRKPIYLIESLTRYLPICSIVHQPTTIPKNTAYTNVKWVLPYSPCTHSTATALHISRSVP